MPNLNQVNLIGNLTRDPELRYSPKGTAVAKASIAINRTWKSESGEKKEEVTFVDVDVFGRTAENLSKYCTKGKSILVIGRLKLNVWTDKATNKERQKLTVVAEQIQYLGERGEQSPAKPGNAPPPQSSPAAAESPEPEEDDVPF